MSPPPIGPSGPGKGKPPPAGVKPGEERSSEGGRGRRRCCPQDISVGYRIMTLAEGGILAAALGHDLAEPTVEDSYQMWMSGWLGTGWAAAAATPVRSYAIAPVMWIGSRDPSGSGCSTMTIPSISGASR